MMMVVVMLCVVGDGEDCGNGDDVDSVDDGENVPYERLWKE